MPHSIFRCAVAALTLVSCTVDDSLDEATSDITTLPTVPLYTWYSASRGDTFTTSDPAWAPAVGSDGQIIMRSGYRFVTTEGLVFSPDAPQPPDTVRLWSWYSPTRGDNFITSNPAWNGASSWPPDYYRFRLEGYAYSKPVANTRVLRGQWKQSSSGLGDNRATANPDDAVPSSGYTYVRDEGYILPVNERFDDLARAQAFGYGHLTVNGKPARGSRRLLVIRATLPDSPLTFPLSDLQFWTSLWNASTNLADSFREVSHGLFTFQDAGYKAVTLPPGLTTATLGTILTSAINAATTVNWATYDTNGDGQVTPDELSILVVSNRAQ